MADANDPDHQEKDIGRARRTKQDREGRFAALQKLKDLKGTKNKVTITEVDNVYEEVDEREYSKRVQRRQEDDWIIDDDGSGYIEDGREVFDDDLGDDNAVQAKSVGRGHKKKDLLKCVPGRKNNIKNMLIGMPSKNKEKDAKSKDDDILGDIMQELNSTPSSAPPRQTVSTLKRKALTPGSTINRTPTSIPRAGNTLGASRLLKAEPKRLPFAGGASNIDDIIDDCTLIEESNSQCQDYSCKMDNQMEIDEFDSQPEIKNYDSQSTDATIDKFNIPCEENVEQQELKRISSISEFDLTSGWETIKNNVDVNQSVAFLDLGSNELPLIEGDDGEQYLRMYWFDAYEDPYVQSGTVYLFGKTYIESAKTYVSCCVSVKNIEKHIYVLPRETVIDPRTGQDTGVPVNFMDVYEEFNTRVADRYKIAQFKSRRVLKKYGFEPASIPRESEYLEVKYSAEHNLPTNLKGATFSHIFGANTSALENFLLDKRIKGPCWLNVKNPQKANPPVSWCKVEAAVPHIDQIELDVKRDAPPPLAVLSLSLRTVVNSRSQQVEIVAISCLVQNEFHIDRAAPQPAFQQHFCILSRPTEEPWPLDHRDSLTGATVTKIERTESERALLNCFLAKINKIDPDVIVGHDVASYDLDILLHRLAQNKADKWSRLGRLRRTNIPQSKGVSRSHLAMSGRLVCDVKISAKELIRARSYDLESLCQQVLNLTGLRPDLSSDAVKKMYSSSASLIGMVAITMQDAANTLRLMYELNVLPLALQITSIAGNLLSRTLLGGRSERNEYLLLHAFHEKGYIVPDRQAFKKSTKAEDSEPEDGAIEKTSRSKKGRRKPAYAGGLVLDPKRGFYDKYVLLMDFNSLYPSIIQEFNICFTTVDRQITKASQGEEEVLPDLPDSALPPGILPTEIRKLVDSRREVKKLINDKLSKDLLLQYDIRQKALKLTANSMYGCLGFSNSRFYAKPLAALITSKGREILLQTRDLVRKMNLDVIYGDTDSLMIDSNSVDYDQVMKIGIKIKQEVNKLYKHLELDIDGVFQRLLLLKKKKYAAVTVTQVVRDNKKEMITQQEIKGLDIVRRDWSQLAIQAGKYALEQILGDLSADERIARIQQKLEDIRDGFRNGTIDLSLLQITKQLTKNPENYPDAKNLSHVQVAIRTNSRGGKKLVQGDTVSFIICQDGSNMVATQRAYSMEEMKMPANAHLKPDIQYYLAQQVHPVVARLCDLLEGIDAVRIAEFLGIDPSGYRSAQNNSNEHDTGSPPVTDEERFQSCEKFYFQCSEKTCGFEMSMDNVFRKTDDGYVEFALSRCGNSNCKKIPFTAEKQLVNRLTLAIRKHIQLYYAGWMICEDQSCATRTRRIALKSVRAHPVCIGCGTSNMVVEYNDFDLYTQLCYYQHMFDASKAINQLKPNERDQVKLAHNNSMDKTYKALLNNINQTLLESAYSQVNLAGLFYSFNRPKSEASSTY
ncbi:DNA polymerase [Daphnia magna]|uniref:DNA polymerase n=1 Tax=Daphnia magna TaxID=35525 RepID=A0A164RG35_9CRUS|nr:DNA polymerase [Daphnia magna]